MQNRVSEFNSELAKWCGLNDIALISTVPHFLLGTGETDFNCFMYRNGSVTSDLSRIGAVRLLDAISKNNQTYLSSDWEKIKTRDSEHVSFQHAKNSMTNIDDNIIHRNYFAPLLNNVVRNRSALELNNRYPSHQTRQ